VRGTAVPYVARPLHSCNAGHRSTIVRGDTSAAHAAPEQNPVQPVVTDDLRRNRLTSAFRLLLAIPHFLWLFLWAVAAVLAQILRYLSQLLAFFSWITAILLGRVPRGIRDFAAFALRFEQQTNAYLYLLTGRYPGFDLHI